MAFSSVRQKAKRWLRSLRGQCAVLMYHRIAENCTDPWRLCVSPHRFSEHLQVLSRDWNVISLRQLVTHIQNGRVPRRSVVITFDDGYACNHTLAKPLLQKSDITATLFIASGLVTGDKEAWWDELERMLLDERKLPSTLSLTIDEQMHRWELGSAVDFSTEQLIALRETWPHLAPPKSRLRLFYDVWKVLHNASREGRDQALNQLNQWCESQSTVRSSHRMLTSNEVVEMAKGTTFEIGAHTVSHPSLAAHSRDYQLQEMQRSMVQIADLINQPVEFFSYPHGEYNATTLQIAADLKIKAACTTDPRSATRSSSLLEVPRYQIEDWDGDTFEHCLRSWL